MPMRIRSLKYFLTEGFKSFCINGLMSAASAIIVTACLLIFGIYILFSMNINYIGTQLKSQYEIQVFVKEGTSQAEVKNIGQAIKACANVKDAVFFSKAEALIDYKNQLGESAVMLDGLENDNPLRDSYKVTVLDLKNVSQSIDEISKIPNIANVKNNKDAMDKIVGVTSVVKNISFWLMLLLGVISIFIISNTIKITVFARRRDINIMKYLGATDSFISWPFIIEGVIIGIIGAIVSLVLATQGYNYFISVALNFLGDAVKLYSMNEIFWQLAIYFACMSITLGAVGSGISLRRHLHV